MFSLYAKASGQAYWLGSVKIKFQKGRYSTENEKIAAFLRTKSECSEIVEEKAVAPVEAPAAKPVKSADKSK